MDLRALRCFVAVAEEGHFGRAAARLHLAQPPLSRRIRELEADLGCRLFERIPTGARLTPAGEVLLAEARDLLERAERARERVRGAESERVLVLGTVAGAGLDVGAAALSALRRERPGLRVRLREAPITDPSAGLREARVDLALTRLPFDTSGLTVRLLGEEPLVAALPADDTLAGRPRLHVAELAGRPRFRLPPGTDARWRAYWLGAPDDVPGPVVSSLEECLHAVLWEGTVGLLPAGAALRHARPGIAFVPVDGHAPSRIVTARRATTPDPRAEALAQALTAAFARRPPADLAQ
ncbi:LysR family transcriptional regulator [Streptomyces collinus]|uniref:Putative LysR family transcriptional regulator n=1 Tax=Streptomyces collinus (strain DSM 40733 / Tue 365) TaxID=1214242 RepID=S5VEI7_STRC3|nr:LysR substrate-binding domain-containing protein [Streptomyces collinus]AGS67071.1 putative LysR family transcriptional regulator [Streptomyces collinus Tu 365]AGS73624.1 putative LysR family transcriptional regulator [Streptomyces collinus Tu 365]